jgi:ketosteroid isomerase-like protein
MSQENVELVYRSYAAMQQGDLETYLALHDPECEIF